MSLDIYLSAPRLTEVWSGNITHNLGAMANAIVFDHSALEVLRRDGKKGPPTLYHVLWRPEELGLKRAIECIGWLERGLVELSRHDAKERLRVHEPSNGLGSHDSLLNFVRAYLEACRQDPDAEVRVLRWGFW